MTELRVSLFQSLRLDSPEGRPLDLGSPTTRSLLAYLILNRARPVDRRRLAFIFWPRGAESAARRNLRQYLHRIRRALEPVDPEGQWVQADGNHVQFEPPADLWLDVESFRHGTHPEASLIELQSAVSLYTGDLLEDIYEDWCVEERNTLRQIYLSSLERLCLGLQHTSQLEAAIQYAQKWTAAEPLDEAAHRLLMKLYTLNGERNRALQHYQVLTETLARELDTAPMPETRLLLDEIQSNQLITESGHGPSPRVAPPLIAARPAEAGASPALIQAADTLKAIPIIGRHAELTRLHAALQTTWDDRGCFLLITGESGIGKTRLVQEYLTQHKDLPILHYACHELESMLPYAPLRHLLQQALDRFLAVDNETEGANPATFQQLLPALRDYLHQLRPENLGPEQTGQVSEGLLNMVTNIVAACDPQPLQIILDDLHWADTPTWNFLAQLTRYASGSRLLVIAMCRLEDLPYDRTRLIRSLERYNLVEIIPLRRLTPSETAALAAHLLPQAEVDAIFLHRLYQETEGNPFFIIEIVLALRESGRVTSLPLDSASQAAAPGLPLSIQRVIEARLDRLSPGTRELLYTAASIGRAFTFSLLQEISQISTEEILQSMEEWLHRGLIREDELGYDFSHDKIRQVAYASLSRARRQYVHRRISAVLETAIPAVEASTLAYHYARSDQPLKALPFLTRAGEQALQARSYQEARQFGLQAVSLLGRLPGPRQRSDRLDLNLQLAQAYAFSGDLARAQEILIESEGLALTLDEPARLGKLFHRLAQILWLRGQPEAAGDYARRTLRAAEEFSNPLLLQAALRMLGRVSIALSAFDDAIAYLLRYTNLEADTGAPPDLPIVLGYLGISYARVGSWSRAFEAARRGVTLAELAAKRESGTRSDALSQAISFARMQLAFVHADYRDWTSCLDILASAPELLDPLAHVLNNGEGENGDTLTPLGFMLLGLRGLALAHLGEPRRGIETILPALAWAERTDYRVFHYLPRLYLADCLLQAGEIYAARPEAERALASAHSAGSRWAAGVALRLLGEILARQSNPDWIQVESHLINSLGLLRQVRARPDLARTYLALRKLYDRAGQIAWAVDCHFRATSIFEELGMVEELRQAQGQAAGERRGAVVIPGIALKGPNVEKFEQ
ncbi:MAG TPA: AAA family ATPase [Anaerolineales bacterium]|nr:AAA family ATPase [Anaerolineales bacterium]